MDELLKALSRREQHDGEMPIIIGIGVYEYLGQPVSIVRAEYQINECVIETRFGERATVCVSDLQLRTPRP